MTAPLGDSFPEELRKRFCDEHLAPGAVLRIHSRHTRPPKEKRCVVIGISESDACLALAYFNTERPSSPYLQPSQWLVKAEGRPYLEHDSYLDCAQLYEEDLRTVRRVVIEDISIYLGQMSKQDLTIAQRVVSAAKSVPMKLKKKYGLTE